MRSALVSRLAASAAEMRNDNAECRGGLKFVRTRNLLFDDSQQEEVMFILEIKSY